MGSSFLDNVLPLHICHRRHFPPLCISGVGSHKPDFCYRNSSWYYAVVFGVYLIWGGCNLVDCNLADYISVGYNFVDHNLVDCNSVGCSFDGCSLVGYSFVVCSLVVSDGHSLSPLLRRCFLFAPVSVHIDGRN